MIFFITLPCANIGLCPIILSLPRWICFQSFRPAMPLAKTSSSDIFFTHGIFNIFRGCATLQRIPMPPSTNTRTFRHTKARFTGSHKTLSRSNPFRYLSFSFCHLQLLCYLGIKTLTLFQSTYSPPSVIGLLIILLLFLVRVITFVKLSFYSFSCYIHFGARGPCNSCRPICLVLSASRPTAVSSAKRKVSYLQFLP